MAKIEEVNESPRIRPDGKKVRQQSAVIKYYLVAYNLASALGWAYVLVGLLVHLFNLDRPGHPWAATLQTLPIVSRAATVLRLSRTAHIEARLPPALRFLVPVLRRAASAHARVGGATAVVQTCAALEVAHSLLGWVRSPLATVAMQVASRYYAVWGVSYLFESTRTNPLYASMVLSWSVTEVIRYVYYACNLLGREPYPLLWIRYTTFYVLYPTGASSEAFLIFSTLPTSTPLYAWSPHDVFRLAMFCIWWPSLYVLYTHMIKQRRRVLGVGKGRTLGAKPKSL